MTRKEGVVERSERITSALADKMVDDIRKLQGTLQVRPWGAPHLSEADKMAVWETVSRDPEAIRQMIAAEQAGLHLPPGLLPKGLLREMDTMENRYQAGKRARTLQAAIPVVAPPTVGTPTLEVLPDAGQSAVAMGG